MKHMPVSQRVVHDMYGHGTITEVETDYTIVEFDLHGRKKFVTSIVVLKPSDEPQPPRRKGSRSKAKKT